MTADRRTADRKDLDALTREFLDKGGKIVQCPPGSSENVVYKRGSFKRRAPSGTAAAGTDGPPEAAPAPTPAGDTAPGDAPAGERST